MIKKIIPLFLLALLVFACSSDENSGGSSDNFNRGAMLENWADNIIIPAYQSFNTELSTLKTTSQTFTTTSDQTNLDAFRAAWLDAYKSWQHVEMFNIGKAEELNYGFNMNIYPASVTEIENNVTNGGYDLTHVNNQDAQGFPALDYLLYGVGADDTAILAKYTSDPNATKYKTYITDVVNRMDNLTQQVINDWNGTYRNTFVASTDNTATSAVNKLVNDFIYYYEKGLRAGKIGIPAGVWAATPLPDRVEAYYRKDVSKDLNLEALQAVQDFFNGKYFNSSTTGESLKSYLDYLNTIKNGDDLSALINTQYNTARTKIQGLNNDYTLQIANDNTKMTEAYDALQVAVVLMKVDMLQAFNISVDYVDADGD